MEPRLVCYRLDRSSSYDEEIIWAFIQRSGGEIAIHPDVIDFWVRPEYESLLVCAWPLLTRQQDLDLI